MPLDPRPRVCPGNKAGVGDRKFGAQDSARARRATEGDLAAERLDAVLEADKAGTASEAGATAAVVANRDAQGTGDAAAGDPGPRSEWKIVTLRAAMWTESMMSGGLVRVGPQGGDEVVAAGPAGVDGQEQQQLRCPRPQSFDDPAVV